MRLIQRNFRRVKHWARSLKESKQEKFIDKIDEKGIKVKEEINFQESEPDEEHTIPKDNIPNNEVNTEEKYDISNKQINDFIQFYERNYNFSCQPAEKYFKLLLEMEEESCVGWILS